jgi:hypothetical protein
MQVTMPGLYLAAIKSQVVCFRETTNSQNEIFKLAIGNRQLFNILHFLRQQVEEFFKRTSYHRFDEHRDICFEDELAGT